MSPPRSPIPPAASCWRTLGFGVIFYLSSPGPAASVSGCQNDGCAPERSPVIAYSDDAGCVRARDGGK